MYKITSASDGADLGMTETPYYIQQAANGCFIPCSEPAKAQGICFAGVPYNLLGTAPMEGAADTVLLLQVDAGSELASLQKSTREAAFLTGQLNSVAKLYVQGNAAGIADTLALEMPDLFKTWDEVLAAGTQLEANTILNDGGQLYRVVQAVTPQAHQAPHDEGMLAVYRPIEPDHAGTQEDPIPWRYGMDCTQGKYYSYGGKTYLCNLTMPACVWAPGTEGLWQWSEVTA